MSEYTTIWEAVRFGTLKDVIEIFKKGDEKIGDASGDSILFHALANNDSTARYEIANFLINKGADVKIVRAIYKKEKTVSFKGLFNIGTPEIEMLPLYQLIFSQPGLPLLVKDKWGLTVIEFARRFNRPIAVKMMEDYVKKYNLKEEN